MAGRVHEHPLDGRRGLVVRVGVPADVLAGDLVAEADRRELGEDPARVAGDVMAEVVAVDHVLAAPASNRGQRRVHVQGLQAGARSRAVGEGDQLGLG